MSFELNKSVTYITSMLSILLSDMSEVYNIDYLLRSLRSVWLKRAARLREVEAFEPFFKTLRT